MKINHKTFSLLIVAALVNVLLAPAVFAVECDQDKDGYISLSQSMLVDAGQGELSPNGDYQPEQWAGIFEAYKTATAGDTGLDDGSKCDSLNFKKGAEPLRCDQLTVSSSSGVYDTAKVNALSGKKVNPGAFDVADNGIDEDCNGTDGALLPDNAGAKDLGGLAQKAIALLGNTVAGISIAILIWGGILYATAAGDEQKTSKARKAILGAIIGLAVGLLAPSVVSWVVASLA